MRWMRTKDNLRQGLLDFIDYLDLKDAIMVEIGCYAGESTEMFASSGKFSRVIAVDPWQNGYDKNDIASKQMAMSRVEALFDKRMSKYKGITKMKMTGDDAFYQFEDESIDLVYIDGDHRYDAVKNDIEKWLPKVKSGGYITGHDYFTKNKKVITDVKRAVDEVVGPPDKTFQDNSWIVKKG